MPNRILRENIRYSQKAGNLTDREFRLFIMLLTVADDFGRYHGDPQIIRSACYTYGTMTSAKVEETRDALRDKGMIDVYNGPNGDNHQYVQIAQFDQRLRAMKSKYPKNEDARSSARDGTHTAARVGGGGGVGGGVGGGGDKDKIEKVKDPGSKQPRSFLVAEFDDKVWPEYPKKQGKAAALEDYIKARRSGTSMDTIRAGVNAYVNHIKASGTEAKYVKQGSSWFHQQSWLDDYSTPGTGRQLRRAV